jgi:signal transduction histidine kinase/CheY-like chemotaxis protein/HPt (histidine-containing phosphotransfer) domain-containing protein
VGSRFFLLLTAVLCLLGTLWPSGASGQSYTFRSYTIDDGLPSPEVEGLAQDASGRVWFATRAGAAAFDGYSWELPELPVQAMDSWITCDSEGSIWILGNSPRSSPTLSKFDGHRWTLFKDSRGVLPGDAGVTAFAVASGGQGGTAAAFGTRQHGLFIWFNGSWQRIDRDDGLSVSRVHSIASWRGQLYVATESGLCVFRDGTLDPSIGRMLPPDAVVLAVAVNGSAPDAEAPDLWVLTSEALFRLSNGAFVTIYDGLGLGRSARELRNIIAPDPPYAVYFNRSRGLYRLELPTGMLAQLGTESGLPDSPALDLMIDRESNLWVATIEGAHKLVSLRFGSYGRENGLLDNEVTAICEPRPGMLLFGHNNGLSLHEKGGGFKHIQFPPILSGIGLGHRVIDLVSDDSATVWIAANRMGLGRLGPSGNLDWIGSGGSSEVSSVLVKPDGTLLVGGDHLSLYSNGSFEPLSWDVESYGVVRRLTRLSDGSVAIASSGSGLLLLQDRQLRAVPGPQEPGTSSIYTALEDRAGRLWVGTRGGLLLLEGGELVRVSEEELLSIAPVFLIIEDRQGNLWFGSASGVSRWDGVTVRHFTANDGLAGRETNRGAGLVDSNGHVWLGTDSGVSIYRQELDRTMQVPPIVELLDVEVDGERVALSELGMLEHHRNNLSFQYRGVSFVDESALTYRIFLEGFDTGWSKDLVASRRSARYTSLQPGTYKLQIKARSADGIWSEPVLSPPIVIRKPIWKEWWFIALAVALGGGLAFLAAQATVHWRYAAQLESEVVQRRQTEQELIRANRARSEFLANISHEIRTPLNAVIGLSGLMLDSHLTSSQRSYTQTVHRSASSLLMILNDILDYSEIETGRLSLETLDFDLRSSLQSACEIVSERASDKGLELVLEIGDDVPCLLAGDSGRLQQIVVNLVDNAIKFTEKGKVSVKVTLAEEDDSSAVIRCQVQDTGIGIPDDKRSAVFEAFTQADGSITRSHYGTGLGLSIASRLCEMLGGRIELKSEVGKGSSFWFTLAFAKQPPGYQSALLEDVETTGLAAPAVHGGRPARILMAEDNPVNQRVAAGILERMGCHADVVGNGLEALKALETVPYDLVLMDVQMPAMDGLEATRQVRSPYSTVRNPKVPIIAITAHASQEYREMCFTAGMDDFVVKPIQPGELAKALARWITPVLSSSKVETAQEEGKGPGLVFDRDEVLERLGGDESLLEEISEIFFNDVPGQIASIEGAIERGDCSRVAHQAHTLKGASGSFGAHTLQAAALAIEEAALSEEIAQLRQGLLIIKDEFEKVRQQAQH